ncbi:MAG: glycosyltransferase [Phycisphaera sp.]|nr:glycosyltransferase [Phycisphaera sp.]
MRILYVSQYFPPEVCAPAARVYDLSRQWVRQGHDVTVLTAFAHHPTGVKAKADRWTLTRRERVDDIDVVRTYVYATPNEGVVRRMMSYASFMTSAGVIGAARAARPDVVIATSPQLLTGVAGWALAKRFGVPFVFEVRDLWPESILAVDAMRDNAVIRGLKRVAAFLYRRSDAIVTVGDGYRRQLGELYGVPADKVRVIPNGVDPELFTPGDRDNDVRRAMGWGDKRVAMYIGTIGMAHGLETVLDAAAQLRDRRADIVLALVGEGADKARLKQCAAERGLNNVCFVDLQPKQRIPAYYAACDVGLVCLRDAELFRHVLPSKLFEYMAMARPVLINVDGDARRLVESAGAGLFVEPNDAAALAGTIARCVDDAPGLERMGAAGRACATERYTRPAQATQYIELLRSLVDPRPEADATSDTDMDKSMKPSTRQVVSGD